MLWYEKIFAGKSVKDRVDEIRDHLSKKEYVPGLYLITLASNGVDQLDILHYGLNSRMMRQYLELPPVVGLAGNKREALQLVQDILRQVYAETGGCDMRGYFQREMSRDPNHFSEGV